ncbi:MAG: hypothetical protein ACXABO_14755 [Promethearchaeota archaeon]
MKKEKRVIGIITIIILLVLPLNLFFLRNPYNPGEEAEDFLDMDKVLRFSDIAGTDLYAEQINAYIAGNKSIIKQSLFTNDTNIFAQFDTKDPAFYKCNVLISASNTITPSIFPKVLTESEIAEQYVSGFNRFVGFLYYDDDLSSQDAILRAERALEIIKRKFQIDLIMVNVSQPNFFPFIGDYPNWNILLEELTNNLPMDGYWKTLDVPRITSEEYLKNHHLSSTFMVLNSIDFFEGDFNLSTTQIDYNIDSLDFSFLENLATEELLDQFDTIIDSFGDLFNATISEEELEQFIELFSSFTLSNDSHYTSMVIQYEGLPEGIEQVGKNEFKFDLWEALGYQGGPLKPSEKIYIALVGAFMTDIEINILCTDIIDATPINYEFYDFLIEQIALIFYLSGTDIDVQVLKDYSFELFWVNEEGIKRSYVKIVNLNDPNDFVNLLQQFGFQGFPFIPTGLVNPINQYSVTYNISNSEPNLLLKKKLVRENATFGAYRNFTYQISAENVGNLTAWGTPTPLPLELDDFLTLISPLFWEDIKNDMWTVINIEYPDEYESLEDFFNFDEDPLIFYFDSLGSGTFDTFYPDILNITNLWPYNKDADDVIDIIATENPGYFNILPSSVVQELLTNNQSVWNKNNWKIDPGNNISYQINNVSIANLDTFSPFHLNNFTIDNFPETPEIISGSVIGGTSPEMALTTDNESWVIESIEKFSNQEIEIDFLFTNDTSIGLENNSLERVSIIINFTTSTDLESLNFRIYNFEIEEFQDMEPYLDSIVNNSRTYAFVNYNESLDWLFYSLDYPNYTVLFEISGNNPEKFNISIDNLDIRFSSREININEDTGARVVFGSNTGNIQFERKSNSILLSTFDMASIITTSNLARYSGKRGDLNTYTLNLKNIGSKTAANISISLIIPGILADTGEFTVKNSNMSYYLSTLSPFEEKTINFSFYIPNSRKVGEVSIFYNNPENIEGGNSTKLQSVTNEVYISAPVDYEEEFPFLRIIEFNYQNKSIPVLSHNLDNNLLSNLTFILKNINPYGNIIPDLNITLTDRIEDLKRVDTRDITFKNVEYNETVSFNITLKKGGWKGYYYPPINFFESSEGKTIQIRNSPSIILGIINFTIKKYIEKEHLEIGDELTVFIEIKNTGSLNVSNIIVNDIISYSQSEFSLIMGKLVFEIIELKPGKAIIFSYTLKAKKQALVTLNPACITYYYLLRLEIFSNNVFVKINTPQFNQYMHVIIPILAVGLIFIIYKWKLNIYNKKKGELRRAEMHIFEMTSSESILKTELTLRERMGILSRKTNRENE